MITVTGVLDPVGKMFYIISQPPALVTILLVSVTSVTSASVPLASRGSSAKTGHPDSPWWTTYREKFLPTFYKEIVGALILKQSINKNQSMHDNNQQNL